MRKGGTDTNTEGLFERVIRTSRIEQIDWFSEAKVLDQIGNVANVRTQDAGGAADKLRFAIFILLQGAPTEPGSDKRLAVRLNDRTSIDRAKEWMARFDRLVDEVFFDQDFWAHAADRTDDLAHRLAWRERLRTLARTVLGEAAEAAPRTEMRRIRAIARSRTMLDAQMTKWLKEIA